MIKKRNYKAKLFLTLLWQKFLQSYFGKIPLTILIKSFIEFFLNDIYKNEFFLNEFFLIFFFKLHLELYISKIPLFYLTLCNGVDKWIYLHTNQKFFLMFFAMQRKSSILKSSFCTWEMKSVFSIWNVKRKYFCIALSFADLLSSEVKWAE